MKNLSAETTLRYLGNGMQMCLHPSTFAPVVSVQIWVKTGSIDEEPAEYGMAHVLEHMVFKGTKNYPAPGQIASLVEFNGGELNAYTTFDHTVYHITAPKDFLNEATNVLWDMVFNALFDEQEVKRELEVVIEEIRRGRDNPGSILSQGLFKMQYAGTPVGRPVIGFEEVVRTFDAAAIRRFYDKWYVPNNMMFIGTGDFDAAALTENLTHRVPNALPRNLPQRQRPALPPAPSQPPVWIHRGPFQEVRIQVCTQAPTLNQEACAPWEMFASLLGSGDSSRLARVIRDERQLATYVGASTYTPAYPAGLFCLSLFAQEPQALAAVSQCVAEIKQLAQTGPQPDELKRVLSAVQAGRIYAQESVDGVSRTHGQSLLTDSGLQYDEQFVAQLQAVTCEDVQKIAQQVMSHIAQGHFCAAAVVNTQVAFDATTLEETIRGVAKAHEVSSPADDAQGALAPQRTVRVSPLHPAVRSLTIPLPQGRSLNLNLRSARHLPIASFSFYSRVGSCFEDICGTASLTADLLTRGTQKQTQRQFIEELETLSSSVSASSTRDFFGLRGDCLSEHIDRTLELFFDALLRPTFLPGELRKAVRETQETLVAQKDSPGVQLSKRAAQLLHGSHPYANPLSGTPESLLGIDADHVKTHWRKILSRPDFVMSLAGCFEEEAVISYITQEFTAFFEDPDWNPLALAEVPPPPDLREPQIAFLPFEREQAHILLTTRAYPLSDKRRTALELAMQILSGQGGRLFLDLRDVRSLAYSVGASQSPQLLAGSVSCYIGTQSNKAQEALEGLKEHLEKLANELPSESEHGRAQNALLGSQSIDAQHVHYQATQLAMSDLLGLGFDHFLGFRERVLGVSREDVSAALKHVLTQNPPCVVILGPQGTWVPERPLSWRI